MAPATDPVKGLTRRYLIALLILAVLATGAMVLLQVSLTRQAEMIEAIAATQRQNRLIKDAMLASRQMIDARSPIALQTATLGLEQDLARLQEAFTVHGAAVSEDTAYGMIARQWPVFHQAARLLAQEPPRQLTPYHPSLPQLRRAGTVLTAALDQLATQQIAEHGQATRRTVKLALAVWSGSLLIIYLIGNHLFRPMTKRIRSGIAALRRAMVHLKREQEALEVANTLLKAELDAAPHGVIAFDHNGRLISYNQRFVDQWGLDEEDLSILDTSGVFRHIHAQCIAPDAAQDVTRTILDNENIAYTDLVGLEDGRCFERSTRPLLAAGGRLMGRIWFFRDESEQAHLSQDKILAEDAMARNAAELAQLADELYLAKAAAEQTNATLAAQTIELERLAATDVLTDLANRRAFFKAARTAFAAPLSEAPMSVIMLDIDHFKALNDRWGHETGDKVLQEVAAALRLVAGDEMVPARIGGEEFALLLPGSRLTIAIGLGEQVRMAIAGIRLPIGEEVVTLTASVGVAQRLRIDASFDALLNRADSALYQAKHNGRNRVMVHNGPMAAGADQPSPAARVRI